MRATERLERSTLWRTNQVVGRFIHRLWIKLWITSLIACKTWVWLSLL